MASDGLEMVGIRTARTVVQGLVDGLPGSRASRRAHDRTECWGSVTFAGDGSSRTIATATNSAPHPLLPCAPWQRQVGRRGESRHHRGGHRGGTVHPLASSWEAGSSRPTNGPSLLRDATPSSHPGPARVLQGASCRIGHSDGGLPPEVLLIHAWLAVAMVVKGGDR